MHFKPITKALASLLSHGDVNDNDALIAARSFAR
jgi:hypothetical protein